MRCPSPVAFVADHLVSLQVVPYEITVYTSDLKSKLGYLDLEKL